MTTLVMLFGLVCGTILQAVLPAWNWMGQAKPPLLLGLVLYYAFRHERRFMLQAAIAAGLLQDALGRIPLGYSSFGFCLVGVITSKFKDLVFVQTWITHLLSGALSNLGLTLLLAILLVAEGTLVIQPGWVLVKCLGALLLGAVFVPVVYRLMENMDRMMGNVSA